MERKKKQELKFSCEVCEKSFPNKTTLRKHIKSSHTEENPLECNICNKVFSLKQSLNRHKQLHTGIKAYTCDLCEKNFL